MKGFERKFPALDIFSSERAARLLEGTMRVLETTGVRMEHSKGREVLHGAGCSVDAATNRVRIPRELVTKSFALCPRSFSVRARDPQNDITIGGDRLYFVSGCGMNTLDIDTRQVRPATRKETLDGIRVLDSLDNLHLLLAFSPYFGWEGLAPVMGEPEMTAAKARFSTKVQMTGSVNGSEIFAIKIAKAIGCEVLGLVNPTPPLTWYGDAVEALWRYCEADVPFHISSGGCMGMTAPASIAGAVITTCAELSAGIVLAQILRPGARLWVGNFVTSANMLDGSIAFGSIANSLTQAAFNEFWRPFGIPVWGAAPAYTSSKSIDFQCGVEKAMGAILAAVCGSHAVHMHGGVYAELTWHPVQAILDDDIAGMVGRFLLGAGTESEDLALDIIDRVGPVPGHFLGEEHTLDRWESLEYIPKAADRLPLQQWKEQGRPDSVGLAMKRLKNILAQHEPVPLGHAEDAAVDEILSEARSHYRQKGQLS